MSLVEKVSVILVIVFSFALAELEKISHTNILVIVDAKESANFKILLSIFFEMD